MVVMDPDEITRLIHLCDLASKGGVGTFVVWVVGVGGSVFGSDILPEKVVEERPEGWRK